MKKTLSISIGSTLFNIEEDAYQALDTYLSSVREHFAANTDKDEIMKDIETRIAERFAENAGAIVSLLVVETVIADMGSVSEIDPSGTDSEQQGNPAGEAKSAARKQLYRDTDTAVIAGVASGLAQYFGIDVVVVRVIFVIGILLSGATILIYVILWFAVPEAKSASQKLEMRGDPVTLATVSSMVKEKIDSVDAKAAKSGLRRLLMIPLRILRAVALAIQKVVFPAARIITGSLLMLGGFSVGTSITIGAGIVLFGIPVALMAVPAGLMPHGALFIGALVAGYFAILIPAIFVFFAGLRIIRRKPVLGRKAGFSMLFLWFLALVCSIVLASRIAFRVEEAYRTDPMYAPTSSVAGVDPFHMIVAHDSLQIHLVKGDAYSVALEGRPIDIDRIDARVADGKLEIERKSIDRPCIFCSVRQVTVTVTAPAVDTIEAHDAASIEGDIVGPSATVTLSDGSYGELGVQSSKAVIQLSDGSRLALLGSADELQARLSDGSSLQAADFAARLAAVSTKDGSQARVAVSQVLQATAQDGSKITYKGNPKVTKNVSDGATIRQFAE